MRKIFLFAITLVISLNFHAQSRYGKAPIGPACTTTVEQSCTLAQQWLQSCNLCSPIYWHPDEGGPDPTNCDLTICVYQTVVCPNDGDGNACQISTPFHCQVIRHLDNLPYDALCFVDISACSDQYQGTCFIETSVTLSRGTEMISLTTAGAKIFIDKLRGHSLDGSTNYLYDLTLGTWHLDCYGNPISNLGEPVIMTGWDTHTTPGGFATIFNHL